jgi:hypothetical protein
MGKQNKERHVYTKEFKAGAASWRRNGKNRYVKSYRTRGSMKT